MKQFLFIVTAGLMLALLLSLVPDTAIPKPGPRTIVLREENTVSLNMPIMPDTAADLQAALMAKSRRLPPTAPIYLTLNSPGGSILDGEKIIETAQGLPNPVHTITIFSASMSFIISQYLDRRLILESGTMMSHRAYAEGLAGQVPGNLVSRTLGLLQHIVQIDQDIAARVGMTTQAYQEMIRDESWVRGRDAIQVHFADEVVRVKCDHSLTGAGPAQTVDLGMFKVSVAWSKCPLITQPMGVESGDLTEDQKEELRALLYDKQRYVRQYGASKLLGQ